VEWDPYSFSILTEDGGEAVFRDIVEGQTVHEQVDENHQHGGAGHHGVGRRAQAARIEIRDAKGKLGKKYLLPSGAHLMVEDGAEVAAGRGAGQDPAETAKTKGHHGVSAPVVELFEARGPRQPA